MDHYDYSLFQMWIFSLTIYLEHMIILNKYSFIYTSEFEFYWVLYSYSLVPSPRQKKTCKLLNVLWWKQQAGHIHVCKNEINNKE